MICRTCGNEKNETEFYPYDLGECKACRNARSREYNKTNRAKCYQDHDKYRKTLKWKLANLKSEQKARSGKFTEQDNLTLEQLQELITESKLVCACCGVDVSNYWEIDHRQSIKNGGHLAKGNLQILCPSCNHKKFDRNVYYFRMVASPVS
jgi:5-methylcytosine-specific restriction endonuclease McrA